MLFLFSCHRGVTSQINKHGYFYIGQEIFRSCIIPRLISFHVMVCRVVLILLLGFVFAAWVFCCVYGFCFVFGILLLFGFDLVFLCNTSRLHKGEENRWRWGTEQI